MKKIVALLLSVLMLLSMAAIAEEAADDTALITCISNIAMENTVDGQTQTINLDGFEAYLSLDTADGLALVAQAFNGDDPLMLAVAKLVDTQVMVNIDGMDKTYVAEAAQFQGVDTAELSSNLHGLLPTLLQAKLPMVNIGSIPKADLTGLATMFGGQTSGNTTTFSIPAEMINMLIDQVVEAAKTSGSAIPGLDKVLPLIEQLRASGMSVAIEGSIVDEADKQTVTLNVYPVSGEETAEAPAAALTIASETDNFSLAVDVPNGETSATIAKLDIQTEPATSSLVATLDIAGMMQFNLAAFQEDEQQKFAFTMDNSMGDGFTVNLAYGKNGDADVMDLTFTFGEDVAFEAVANTAEAEDGALEGSIEVTSVTPTNNIRFSADIACFIGSLDLGDYQMPANTASIDEFSSEESNAALQAALKPVMDYFSSLTVNTAA